ncbi:rhodanese-like domain-containing protein [Rhodobacteraceae bacterium]|nr:rhodanese-like domain-containing protein [Paracoccaceae bacterium]|tara:strand:- start:843 stop:1214 length:372 start_codon:yes stop_codon:yes gene_type:complete
MKRASDYLAEANAVVERITTEQALEAYGNADAVFVDVRDGTDIAQSGTVKGAQKINRGFLEFAADDSTPHHNPALQKDANIYVMCAVGGQAALAGKTLKDMGYENVYNIGGFGDWKAAGGAVE